MKMNALLIIPLLWLGTGACSSANEEIPGPLPPAPDTYVPGSTAGIDGDVRIGIASGEASEYQPGENIERSWDGDMSTLYHSPWSGPANFPVTLEYRFKTPEDVDYIVYKPRQDAENGLFGEFELFVATEAKPEYVKVGDYDFQMSFSPSTILFDERIEGATAFKFSVKSGGNDFVSCAEMEFYRYGDNSLAAYSNIFADEVFSELRTGVTREQIGKMDNEFFQTIALALLDGKYEKEFRVQEYEPYPSLKETSQALKIGNYNSFENPTGIYFSSGTDAVVIVGDTGGENLSLRIHNFSNNSDDTFVLRTGINKLSVRNNGLGYISYYTLNWKSAAPVKIHIASGKVNGYFDLAKHTSADWRRLIDGAVSTYFDLKGKWVNLAYTTEDLRAYCTDGYELMQIYDELITMEHEIMGLVKYNLRPKNHMFARTVASGYFADGIGVGIDKSSMQGAVDVSMIRNNIWGPAHEFGHVNQIRPGLKWLGTTEVTNNVYSALVSYHYTGKISLETEDCHIDTNGNHELGGRMNCFLTYGVARGEPWMFQFGQDKMTGYAETGGDLFVKLCPLWQLMLYYRLSDGAPWQKPDWYADVAQIVRETDDADFTNGQHQLNFMRNTMDVLGQNLTDFFITAGMLKPIDKTFDDYGTGTITITEEDVEELVKYAEKYPKPASPVIYYISSQSLPAYVKQLPVEGTFGTGITDNGNDTFTISHNIWKNVAVFETYRGETLDRVAMVGTDSPDRSTTLVRYPAGSTRIEAVAWDGTRTLVYGSR